MSEEFATEKVSLSGTRAAFLNRIVPVYSGERSETGLIRAQSLPLERWLLNRVLELLGEPPIRIGLWDGQWVAPPNCSPEYSLVIRDRKALYQLLSNPSVQFGDLYSTGCIEVEGDLVGMLEALYQAQRRQWAKGSNLLRAFWRDQAPRSTGLREARDNIHHHYDLGNAFYRLWLDTEAMQYTCAYYAQPGMDLAQAQRAKMEHVCRKLALRPGQTVVEAGSGWGGLACYMAEHHGVRVVSYNISREQIAFARQWAQEKGLQDRVEFIEDDYRNIRGEFDVFVSVGMLEHVGLGNYQVLASVIDRCLKPGGLGLIHSIGRNKPQRMNGWIEKRIFPGAYPPSIAEFMELFEQGPFSVLDVENLRLHYAQTLTHWLERFDSQQSQIEAMYDAAFVRAWRLYLAGSIAAFRTGSLQLFQVVFSRDTNNRLPRTREHLYRKGKVAWFGGNGEE